MIESEVRESFNYIKDLCDKYGPRISSSEAETNAAKDIESTLKKYCDQTYLDSFPAISDLYPGGLTKIAGILLSIGIICFFLPGISEIFAIIFPLLGFLEVFVSLFLMKEWFGVFFKKGTSTNATGRIFPRNDQNEQVNSKAKVIVCGHIDSANQMPITRFGNNVFKIALIGIGYILVMLILAILKLVLYSINPNVLVWFMIGQYSVSYLDLLVVILSFIGIPFFIITIKGLIGGQPVMGANDNLSAVAIAVALATYFSQSENRLHNVELWIGGFGSEECGERGAHAFVKKYKAQGLLNNAHAVIPDSIGAGDRITIITNEKMHFARHDPEVTNRMFKAYQEFIAQEPEYEVPCEMKALPFAASDAGRFAHAHIKSGSLIAFDGKIMKPKNWHSVQDTWENLDMKTFIASYGLIKEYILLLENELAN